MLQPLWTKRSGPGEVVFSSPTSPSTQATFSVVGEYVLRLSATDGELSASDDVEVYPLPDLVPSATRPVQVVWTERDEPRVGGTLRLTLANPGAGRTRDGFALTVFEDHDNDGAFSAADGVVGTLQHAELAAGASVTVEIPLDGPVRFRDAVLHVFADSTDAVAETNESNNVAGPSRCALTPSTSPVRPRTEWTWAGSSVLPSSTVVSGPPIVIDLDLDTRPEVVFVSHAAGEPSSGTLRITRGDGTEVRTIESPAVDARAPLATGDIDGDGVPEILALATGGASVLAFEHDGVLKWQSPPLEAASQGAAPSLADLDADGRPEILVGRTALSAEGTLRWVGTAGAGGHPGQAQVCPSPPTSTRTARPRCWPAAPRTRRPVPSSGRTPGYPTGSLPSATSTARASPRWSWSPAVPCTCWSTMAS